MPAKNPISNSSKKIKKIISSSLKKANKQKKVALTKKLKLNTRLKMNGLDFLKALPKESANVAFFDPQYRGVLDYLSYGNEGKKRGKSRSSLPQMEDALIEKFLSYIYHCLTPSGHLFLWVDKFHLCNGVKDWLKECPFLIVDMITWNKQKMGMGYRSRRLSEYLLVLQKAPIKAKGVWKLHDIPDIWEEKVKQNKGVHPKPILLQAKLIEAVSNKTDLIIDPASGSFSVMESCKRVQRQFLGCDING